MKNLRPFALMAFAALIFTSPFFIDNKDIERYRYQQFINNHPFSQRPDFDIDKIGDLPKADRPDLAWQQDFLATMDPVLQRPAKERLITVFQDIDQANKTKAGVPGSLANAWVERGPNNVAGRTRALMFDPNDATHKKVWAGSVGGGLWVNNDITSANSIWTEVNGFWDNIAITCIAYDPNNTNTFYVGTGEGWGNLDAIRGLGIWKTTNGGTTWTQLSSTEDFSFVHDIIVRNENGSSVVYAAVDGWFNNGSWHNSANAGLQRSTNGGTSWSQVLPNIPGQSINFVAADLDTSANNTLWVGTKASPFGATDRGGGRILKSTNGTTFSISSTTAVTNGRGRVAIACAPSNDNYIYALVENNAAVDKVLRTTNGGSSWSSQSEPNDADLGIPASDFSRGQAWYDLVLAVDPNNANTLIVGGIDLFRSTNGGSSWSQISKWSNNQNLNTLNCSVVHADQHAIVFKPGSSSEVIFGNDGGVFYTANVANAASSNVIPSRNNGYNVTQFYACAMHPTAGTNQFLAGAQDNGTQRFTSSGMNSTNDVIGGDGAFCFIDQTNPNYQFGSYVYNNYYRSTNSGVSFTVQISNSNSTGLFINPADYDDNQDILFSSRNNSTIQRINNATGAYSTSAVSISGMNAMASHIRVSPHTTNSSTVFVGTTSGDVYKVTNADGTPSTTNITGNNFPTGNVSCIEIGATENDLLVTFSNYGVTSVFYSSNGGSSWVAKEGNLPDMPVRWALFNPNNYSEVILATEVGVWATTNFQAATPTWTPSNSGLANVRVDMLQIRDSDHEVIAATHGRGLFSSNGFATPQNPTANFVANNTLPCNTDTVDFTNQSINATSYQWIITPNSYTFVNGTNSSSTDISVHFSGNTFYDVKLVATNANGMDSITKTSYINAGGMNLPFSENWEDTSTYKYWTVDNPDNGITWNIYSVSGNSPGTQAAGVDNYSYSASSSISQIDYLVSPSINLNGYNQVDLSFEHAYKRYSSAYQDSMAISVSTDCGNTWTRVASFMEDGTNNWVTGADFSSSFSPSAASDWCGGTFASCKTVSLSNFVNAGQIKVRFENLSGYGNNLYIDNINISGTQGAAPVADFSANKTTICQNDTVQFSDASTNSPTGWTWSFTPNTVTFVNGTSASSQHPEVVFTGTGNYTVSLTASNGIGSNTENKSNFISSQSTVSPSVSIAANQASICAGENVTFTPSATNGGASPVYKWFVNGVLQSTGGTFSSTTLAHNDMVSSWMFSSANCPSVDSVQSNAITISVTSNVTPAVSISANDTTICAGENVVFTPVPTNGGTSPIFKWFINGNYQLSGATFSSTTLTNNDVVTARLISNETCLSVDSAQSNSITISVTTNAAPAVSIAASSDTLCAGNLVTFTATPVNGGTTPTYQWKLNNTNVGSNSPNYSTSSLANGDAVSVVMTSSSSCASPTSATSNTKTMVVNAQVIPSISISASTASICEGQSVTFTSTSTNGGNNPQYDWLINGNSTGSSNNSFTTSSLMAGDSVQCVLTSSEMCKNTPTVTSAKANLTVNALPSVSINSQNDVCENDSPIPLTGTPQGGTFSGTGVVGSTFDPAVAGSGTHTITYTYADANGCSNSDDYNQVVNAAPAQPTIVLNGNTLSTTATGVSYQWFLNGNAIAGATNNSYVVQSNGTYSVEVTDISTGCVNVSADFVMSTFSVEDLANDLALAIFPNPTTSDVRITLNNPNNNEVNAVLYNGIGQEIYHVLLGNNDKIEHLFSLENRAAGIYNLSIKIGDVTLNRNITKSK